MPDEDIELTEEALDMLSELYEVTEKIKELEARKTKLRDALTVEMVLTDNEVTDLPDGEHQAQVVKPDIWAARDVALAGPKASARMLSWLPLMGIGFGTIVGARPISFLTGEWVGHACLLIGAGLEVAGVLWVRRLTRRAEKAA